MTLLVYRATKNGSALVYEATVNGGGTQYTKVLSTTETSTVTLTRSTPTISKILSAVQQSQITLAKSRAQLLSTTQTSTLAVITDTTLAAALTTVVQTSTVSLRKLGAATKSAVQTAIASMTKTFISGAANSTYFITLTTIQTPVASIRKGIQTIKSIVQASTVGAVTSHSGPAQTNVLTTIQRSIVSLIVLPNRLKNLFSGPAGSPGPAGNRRKKIVVEVDGKTVHVNSIEEAREVMALAKTKPQPKDKPKPKEKPARVEPFVPLQLPELPPIPPPPSFTLGQVQNAIMGQQMVDAQKVALQRAQANQQDEEDVEMLLLHS